MDKKQNISIMVNQMNKTIKQRTEQILDQLKSKYPGKSSYDLDGRGLHFVCEVEPVTEHPEFDRAVEVIFQSKPHKHLEMTQYYKVLSGDLLLHLGNQEIVHNAGDKFVIDTGKVHWVESKEGCWIEIYSTPGWTKEDHILVDD